MNDNLNKYPKVNYIGNKEKLTDWIIENLPKKEGTVIDLFCGGCSVSYALKKQGFKVISNDVLYSNYVLAKSLIENHNVILNLDKINQNYKQTKIKTNEFNMIVDKLYYESEVEELQSIYYSLKYFEEYEKYLLLSLIRRAMIRKIPYSRMNVPWNHIKQLRDEEYSYLKYKRKRAYHNESFMVHIKKNLNDYNKAVFDNYKDNKAFRKDAFDLLDEAKEKVDIIYLDPPYPNTMNKYSDFYGTFDNLFDKEINYTDLTNKTEFINKFYKLLEKCCEKSEYTIISINNKNESLLESLLDKVKKLGIITVKSKEHQYKVTGKTNKNQTKEILIIIKSK